MTTTTRGGSARAVRTLPAGVPAPVVAADNLGLVHAALRAFLRPEDTLPASIDRDDLIAAGYLGLVRAVEKFDPARGCTLATYSRAWIIESFQRALNGASPGPRPPSAVVAAAKARVKRERPLSAVQRAALDAHVGAGYQPIDTPGTVQLLAAVPDHAEMVCELVARCGSVAAAVSMAVHCPAPEKAEYLSPQRAALRNARRRELAAADPERAALRNARRRELAAQRRAAR